MKITFVQNEADDFTAVAEQLRADGFTIEFVPSAHLPPLWEPFDEDEYPISPETSREPPGAALDRWLS